MVSEKFEFRFKSQRCLQTTFNYKGAYNNGAYKLHLTTFGATGLKESDIPLINRKLNHPCLLLSQLSL